MRYVRIEMNDPAMPSPTPDPMTSTATSRAMAPTRIGRTRKKSNMNALSGSASAVMTPSAMSAPSMPMRAPSRTNGQRMNASEAPTSRMISISSARATTARRIVLMMMNSTIAPMTARMTTPAVRSRSVTVITRFTRSVMFLTRSTTGSARRMSVTAW